MARFYSNENIAVPVVTELRRLGHDVLTSLDAGNANSAVPDADVLVFATAFCCPTIVATSSPFTGAGLRATLESSFAARGTANPRGGYKCRRH